MTGRQVDLDLPFAPEAVLHARSVVRDLAAAISADLAADAELLVSEVVTNAVLHGAPGLRLRVEADDSALTVRVADGNPHLPRTTGPAGPEAVSGRGLQIVAKVSADWGVEAHPADQGKIVWFCVRGSSRPEADRVGERGQMKSGRAWN